jgi:phosphoglycerate dehydrogenase-like enzyme
LKRLLIYKASYDRLRAEIDGVPGVAPVLMDADGRLTLDGAEVSPEAADAEAAWANNDVFVSPAVRAYMTAVLKSPRLAWVQSGGAGFENPVFAAIVRKGATLTTTHVQAVGIADYVLWGVLDRWQRGPERRANQVAVRWERLPFRDVRDSRWLIVGFGTIGQETAARARAFGAHVTGVRRTPGEHPLADAMVADWREALPAADVVVLSLPLSRETARMADATAFAAMKPGAVFVNVGRGGLVDEAALLAALDRGTPEHAVLDVFDAEPLPADSPFWSHPRVVVTAHTSGNGSTASARADAVFLANLRSFAAGEALDGAVTADEVLASV